MDVKKQPILLSLLSLCLVCLYPCLFQYTGNIPEAKFTDALLFFGIFFAVGMVLYLASLLLTRSTGAAGTLASLGMLVFMNIGLVTRGLKNYLPWLRARYLLLPFLVAGAALLVWMIRKKPRCFVPCLILVLSFGAMNFTALVIGAPTLWEQFQERQERQTQENQSAPRSEDTAQPNVYYYLYDEYAGPQCLQYFYEYDNSAFYEALAERGFNCSMDSYNTQSDVTVRLVPELYDLSYDVPPYFESGDGASPRLYQIFQNMGYQVNLISHLDFLDTDGANVLTRDQESDSIAWYLYENSLLPSTPLAGYLETLPRLGGSARYERMLQESLGLMDTAWEYAQDGPTLTLGYVQCPHSYFLYDRDGNLNPSDQWENWEDPQYYLGILEYVSSRILSTVDEIQKNDPTAIIILQSDHGARTIYRREGLSQDLNDPSTDREQMRNILNGVYLGGETIDISGLSGINTLRAVLNQVYGMDYEMLPEHEPFAD
jgi:hypothetical protein